MKHHGRIVEYDKKGLVVVQDTRTRRHFAFTFDKIKGYNGQSAKEIGLRKGRQVDFSATDEQVEQAELAAG